MFDLLAFFRIWRIFPSRNDCLIAMMGIPEQKYVSEAEYRFEELADRFTALNDELFAKIRNESPSSEIRKLDHDIEQLFQQISEYRPRDEAERHKLIEFCLGIIGSRIDSNSIAGICANMIKQNIDSVENSG